MARKILIVDDETNTVLSLKYLMQQAGYQVETTRTCGEAIDKLSHFAPDLVLLDVVLSQAEGLGLLERLRTDPAWQSVAVIMLAARGRDVEVNKGLSLGANAYITKPFSTQELLSEVQRQLG
jgi:DNA-binding response OmpR family regulator